MSTGNILSCDGHAKLADLEYAKKIGDLNSHDMRTVSESPTSLSGKSFIVSQQGTKDFMSIETAAHQFLFNSSDDSSEPVEPSLTFKQLRIAMQLGEKMAQPETPFFHNHLHDLESLWWIAVWVVFYNNFSEPEPSYKLLDAAHRLGTAQKLFPPTLDHTTRRDAFQLHSKLHSRFRKICDELPHKKEDIYYNLDLLRRFLINNYKAVEAGYPPSINLDASNNDIYKFFTEGFLDLQTLSDGLVLHSVPKIYAKLLKAENLKRPRSESTNDIGVSQKIAKK